MSTIWLLIIWPAGLDPEKTIDFHAFCSSSSQPAYVVVPLLVTESELHRNPTVKAEQEASGHALQAFSSLYPVHQACDILSAKEMLFLLVAISCLTLRLPLKYLSL